MAQGAPRPWRALQRLGLLERRVVGRHEQRREHGLQLRRALGEIALPRRVLHRIRARLEALLEVLVAPQVNPLVGLGDFPGPGAQIGEYFSRAAWTSLKSLPYCCAPPRLQV